MKPGIDAEQVETLKKRMLQDADLGDFWNYYFTDFAEHPSFRTMGHPCRNATISELLSAVGQRISGRNKARVKDLFLIEIPEFQLIHGSCTLEGRIAGLLYFPELNAGVVSVVMSLDGEMVYARIQEPGLERLSPASPRIQ